MSIFSRPKSLREYQDEILGKFILDKETQTWEVSYTNKYGFVVGGKTRPEQKLLQQVYYIHRNRDSFENEIRKFLHEHKLYEVFSNEIDALEIEQVGFCSVNHPEAGMIFFNEVSEERVWRCDLLDLPQYLCFDT